MVKQHFDETYHSTPPENYERFFVPVIGEPVAKDFMRKVALCSGERVLDVACGTGIIVRLALKQVGSTGSVTGVDINPGMLAVARSVIPPDKSIEWHQSSAEDMHLPDAAFDVVICQMGLQFMEDQAAALKEMHRVLVPGGRLFLNVPGPAGRPMAILAEAMEQNINSEAAGFVNRVFSLHKKDELRQLMSGAGFRDIALQARKKNLSLPIPKKFLWQYIYSTPLAGMVTAAEKNVQIALEREVVEKWRQFQKDGGMIYQQRMVTASALK